MVYVLAGEVTVTEGEVVTTLGAGDAAAFPAGVALGHFLENRGAAPCKYLVIGTRAATDVITYPDTGSQCVRVRALTDDIWIDQDGRPAQSPY